MTARVRFVLLLVVALLAGGCTVNPDPIPGGGDATMMPDDYGTSHTADATDSRDIGISMDNFQSVPDGSPPTDAPSIDGPIEGGPDEGGLAGDAVDDGAGATDGGPTNDAP